MARPAHALSVALVTLALGCSKPGATTSDAGEAALLASEQLAGDAGVRRVAEAAPPVDDSALPPASSDELSARMRHLVEALAQDNPDLAADVLFPREAYVALRDAGDPQRGWEKRVSEPFRRAVQRTHKRHAGIERAKYVSFELGTAVVQVPPKKREWKKPLWRVKHSKLTFTVEGKTRHVDIAEMTAWRGAWYVTRLR